MQTIILANTPKILSFAAVGGDVERDGPLGSEFDFLSDDPYFAQPTWERAETEMQRKAYAIACDKAGLCISDVEAVLAGDLQSQSTASSFAMSESKSVYFGLYGACSTMAESLGLAALLVNAGYYSNVAAVTSSHFCTAERQFRFPLDYGGQRSLTSQWTSTAAGALLLGNGGAAVKNSGIRVTSVTPGKILDGGITDVMNMGAAMAPAAYQTLCAHFADLNIEPDYYDLILSGDLGDFGHSIVTDFFAKSGVTLYNYNDCGRLIYDRETQDVRAGGSGCGCSASVLCGHILRRMERRELKRVLFAGTGALMSATSAAQGLTIPGICHAVALETEG
ncbi:MAG: stage V sporulation protein AD [Oscillospiraceae bacterium]|jgi:stage V sporulation protein AD|nr:stage V sporulation protein AD [Oscillospiraceae bacterium]